MPDHHFNSPADVLRFSKLSLEIVQDTDIEDALDQATIMVDFFSPLTDDERSIRVHDLRALAELNLAVGQLYFILGNRFLIDAPPKQVLSSLSIQLGTDFPTPDIVSTQFMKISANYRGVGMDILKMISPVTAGIEASTPIDEIE